MVECKRSDSDLGHALGQYKHHFLALRTPDSPVYVHSSPATPCHRTLTATPALAHAGSSSSSFPARSKCSTFQPLVRSLLCSVGEEAEAQLEVVMTSQKGMAHPMCLVTWMAHCQLCTQPYLSSACGGSSLSLWNPPRTMACPSGLACATRALVSG